MLPILRVHMTLVSQGIPTSSVISIDSAGRAPRPRANAWSWQDRHTQRPTEWDTDSSLISKTTGLDGTTKALALTLKIQKNGIRWSHQDLTFKNYGIRWKQQDLTFKIQKNGRVRKTVNGTDPPWALERRGGSSIITWTAECAGVHFQGSGGCRCTYTATTIPLREDSRGSGSNSKCPAIKPGWVLKLKLGGPGNRGGRGRGGGERERERERERLWPFRSMSLQH